MTVNVCMYNGREVGGGRESGGRGGEAETVDCH